MGIAMPKPVLIGNTYYLRVGVPRDIAKAAKGRTLTLPIGDTFCSVTVGDAVKASLRTKDVAEAKERHTKALAVIHEFWQSVRSGPKPLTHKQILGLAGEIYHAFITAFDEDPGDPYIWGFKIANCTRAEMGILNPLSTLRVTPPTEKDILKDLEKFVGPLADIVLSKHALVTDATSRGKLLKQTSKALSEAALINLAKANGDYSESGETQKYPRFKPPAVEVAKHTPSPDKRGLTFDDVIDKTVKERSIGRRTKPLNKKSENKYRTASKEFAAHRGSDLIATVTAREGDAWKWAMYDEGRLSNSSIAQRIQNVRTVIQWARKQSLGELLPQGNPFDLIERPERDGFRSADKTYTLEEARKILRAARKETKPELRWLPWICAYSGARIGEVANLKPSDFFPHEGDHYYSLTTKGARSLKNVHSIRNVPIHPDLISEGLLEFIAKHSSQPDKRLFPKRSGKNVSDWLKGVVKVTREEIAPNHSWRHLFEDKARAAGMIDSARHLITGRATSSSSDGYGKSEVMLPGLMREMRKVTSYLDD